jgi:predicted permease
MDALWQDVRYAVRRLRKHPGVSAAAVLTVGLAIGTATIVFSALDALLLRPPPFRDPTSLVQAEYVLEDGVTTSVSVRRNEVEFWAGQREIFSAFEGYYLQNLTVLGSGQTRTITAVRVSDGLMAMLGVDASQGRFIGPGDAGTADQPPAVVISHGLWQSVFGAEPSIIGRVVRLDSVPHTVVGIMRPTFRFPFATVQAWVAIPPTPVPATARPAYYKPVGRLVDGLTPALAAERMNVVLAGHPELKGPAGRRASLYRLGSRQVGPRARQVLWMLFAAAILLVLVATANVVNLLITEGESHARQLSVCAALGASLGRMLRGRVIEGVLLTGAGAISGLWVGWAALPVFVRNAPRELWVVQINDITIVWRVAAAATLLAVGCGVVAAIVSVMRTPIGDPRLLRSGARVQHGSRGRWIAGVQLATVTAMLMGASLLTRSYLHMTRVHPGVDVERMVAFSTEAPRWRHLSADAVEQLFLRIEDEVATVPGVERVTTSPDGVPPSVSYDFDMAIEIEGRGVVAANDRALVMTVGSVGAGYFETLGIPLRSGRGIGAEDRAGAPAVAVINETFARRYWPDSGAIGRRFRTKPNLPGTEWAKWHVVVDVAGDVYQHDALAARPPIGVYYAAAQQSSQRPYRTFIVRAATTSPAMLAPALAAAVQRVDPEVPVGEFETGEDMYAQFFAAPRFYSMVTTWMSSLGLLLAVVGVVGLSLVATARRTAEFGVRLALGALPGQIARLVIQQAAIIVGGGITVGLTGGWLVSRALVGLVTGVSPSDPANLAASAGLLGGLALLGCWWPARRALRVTPIEALREE